MEKTETQRLFFALVADGVQEPLAGVYAHLNKYTPILKTVAPANYHVTIKFLGDTNFETFKKLHGDFKNLSLNIPGISFKLQGLGGFPNAARARVIWCGIKTDVSGIQIIQQRIEEVSEKHGFGREDRGFAPHFTLARVRRDAKIPSDLSKYLSDNKDTLYGEARFCRIVLYRSDLKKAGAVYAALEEIRL
jgi:2'-5' RNA ligase